MLWDNKAQRNLFQLEASGKFLCRCYLRDVFEFRQKWGNPGKGQERQHGAQLDLYKEGRAVSLGLNLGHLTILSFVNYNSVDGRDCVV